MKIPCRLAAFDLDGTLLNSNHEVSCENLKALHQLIANETLVVLVSGRMHQSMKPISDLIGLENPIISYNGGMVKHVVSDSVLYHMPVPAEDSSAIIRDCKEQNLHLNFCLNDELYVAKRNEWSEMYEVRTGVSATEVGDLQKLSGEEPTKLLIIHPPEKLQTLLEQFKSTYMGRLYVTQTQPEYIEFMNPEVSKGRALTALVERLDIPLKETVAFGDSFNDESLLNTAGFGIAMRNAVRQVKNCADYITSSNDENGVAEAISKLIL